MEIDCRKVGSVSPVFIGPLSDSRRAARRDAKYFIAGSLIVVSRLFVAFRTTVRGITRLIGIILISRFWASFRVPWNPVGVKTSCTLVL